MKIAKYLKEGKRSNKQIKQEIDKLQDRIDALWAELEDSDEYKARNKKKIKIGKRKYSGKDRPMFSSCGRTTGACG